MKEREEAKIEWKLLNPVLMVIDVQNDFIKEYPKHKKVIPNIKELAEKFRELGLPVIHTQTINSQNKKEWPLIDEMLERKKCIKGSTGAEEVKELENKDDLYIIKPRFSAFYATDLERELHKLKAETIVVTGLLTHCCVYMTALDAYQRDYQVIFVKDGLSSYREKLHNLLLNGFFQNSVGEITTTNKLIKKLDKFHREKEEIEEIEWL